MNEYIHPMCYFITALIMFCLFIELIVYDIIKKNRGFANFNIYFTFLLFLRFGICGIIINGEIETTNNYIKRKEKKRYDCLSVFISEILIQKLARIFFCIGFGYNIGKFINLIFIFKIKDLDALDYISFHPYTLIPIILFIEVILTDFEKASEERRLWVRCTLISILFLLLLAFLLDWAYLKDIKKVSIGLGISFVSMIISFFLFDLIVHCTEHENTRKYTKVEENKIKFLGN